MCTGCDPRSQTSQQALKHESFIELPPPRSIAQCQVCCFPFLLVLDLLSPYLLSSSLVLLACFLQCLMSYFSQVEKRKKRKAVRKRGKWRKDDKERKGMQMEDCQEVVDGRENRKRLRRKNNRQRESLCLCVWGHRALNVCSSGLILKDRAIKD